ncbi:hypothetical protein BpHYR1_000978 [Brachionus plicatilis]|uniref:Uncharacterized protein n=1 Tax=Brachionus plicatilis TaxID=10195 RepID=A0A3M7T3E0_BRAPC|nr:hypothetical protein BpHYR1_000978 [Brachionus plicatilis]
MFQAKKRVPFIHANEFDDKNSKISHFSFSCGKNSYANQIDYQMVLSFQKNPKQWRKETTVEQFNIDYDKYKTD